MFLFLPRHKIPDYRPSRLSTCRPDAFSAVQLGLAHFTGFPQLLKNHWNSDLFQDHEKIIEFHEKFLKFVKMKKSWKNHWILNQLLMEKSLNSETDIVLTYYMGK